MHGVKMAIIGEVHIKVNSTVLTDKAQAVSTSIKNMDNCFEQLESIIKRTSYYWIGEAGDLHRKIYEDKKPQIEDMMKRLKEHPVDLVAMAQTYETTEAMVQSLASELPGDVIS